MNHLDPEHRAAPASRSRWAEIGSVRGIESSGGGGVRGGQAYADGDDAA